MIGTASQLTIIVHPVSMQVVHTDSGAPLTVFSSGGIMFMVMFLADAVFSNGSAVFFQNIYAVFQTELRRFWQICNFSKHQQCFSGGSTCFFLLADLQCFCDGFAVLSGDLYYFLPNLPYFYEDLQCLRQIYRLIHPDLESFPKDLQRLPTG